MRLKEGRMSVKVNVVYSNGVGKYRSTSYISGLRIRLVQQFTEIVETLQRKLPTSIGNYRFHVGCATVNLKTEKVMLGYLVPVSIIIETKRVT